METQTAKLTTQANYDHLLSKALALSNALVRAQTYIAAAPDHSGAKVALLAIINEATTKARME